MTVIIPNFLTQKVVNGLNTYQYTVQNTAMHVARIRTTHPTNTGITITINQNGSPVATVTPAATLPDTGQTSTELHTTINCTSGDVISFALSSSAAPDEQLNTVVSTINVYVGSGN